MPDCELLATCPYFNDSTYGMPEMYKEQYCKGDYSWCGRYLAFKALERRRSLMTNENKRLGKIIKQQRVTIQLTLHELARASGVSPSYLGRIESGDRFPSARILLKIANPLGLNEDELLTLAEYRSPQTPTQVGSSGGRLDPYVVAVLSQEPVEIQRGVVTILSLLVSTAEGIGFREYVRRNYPELDEDMITMIEDLIERERARGLGSINAISDKKRGAGI